MRTIQPLGDRLVVAVKEAETRTKSGIYLAPSASTEKPSEGHIVALGTGKGLTEAGLCLDQLVMFAKYAGTKCEHEGGDRVVLRLEDVIGIIVDSNHDDVTQAKAGFGEETKPC